MGILKVLAFTLVGFINPAVASTSTASPMMVFASESYLNGSLDLTTVQRRRIDCMAKVIFFEARGESYTGKTLVANVVRNRTQFGKPFATSICKVVYQPNQFAWTRDKWKKNVSFKAVAQKFDKHEHAAIVDSLSIAIEQVVLDKKVKTAATHFCSIGEKCNFKNVELVGRVGRHTFFEYMGNS